MADISQIKLPSGTTYDIKDATARSDISTLTSNVNDLLSGMTGAMHYIGISSTALTDGGTQQPTIDNTAKTMAASDAGAVCIYGEKEYVWNGTKWQEFGSTGSLKALAFKDTATVTGTAAAQTFTGTAGNVSVSGTFAESTVTVNGGSGTTTYTPAGTISVGTGTANYTPAGNITNTSFTGTESSVNVSSTTEYMTAASAAIAKDATNGVQISGTVAAPTISVSSAGSTTTVPNVTNVGSTPSWSGTVSGEVLTIAWDAGSTPTLGTAITVKNGDAAYSASAPAFTGDKFKVTVTPTKSAVASSGSFTPAGSVSASFEGTGAQLKFTGTGTRLTGSVAQQSITSTGTFTPAGTNAASSVSGTAS